MASISNGARVAVKVVKDSALRAIAVGAKNFNVFAARVAQGELPIIKLMTATGVKYVAALT